MSPLEGSLTDYLREWDSHVSELVSTGVPEPLATRVASLSALFAALDVVEVASATGRPVDDVAALHLLLGGRLHLHWLRDQIATLPRSNRWEAMARAALRDDLFSLHAELTADVMTEGPAEGEAAHRLDAWMAANTQPVARCLEILGDIKDGGHLRPHDPAGRPARGAQRDPVDGAGLGRRGEADGRGRDRAGRRIVRDAGLSRRPRSRGDRSLRRTHTPPEAPSLGRSGDAGEAEQRARQRRRTLRPRGPNAGAKSWPAGRSDAGGESESS